MSGVYIPNIEKPKDCEECPIAKVKSYSTYCPLKKCNIKKGYSFKDCPLVALPSHGRLIDADELIKRNKESKGKLEAFKGDAKLTEFGYKSAIWEIQDLEDAPTIIEPSKED